MKGETKTPPLAAVYNHSSRLFCRFWGESARCMTTCSRKRTVKQLEIAIALIGILPYLEGIYAPEKFRVCLPHRQSTWIVTDVSVKRIKRTGIFKNLVIETFGKHHVFPCKFIDFNLEFCYNATKYFLCLPFNKKQYM